MKLIRISFLLFISTQLFTQENYKDFWSEIIEDELILGNSQANTLQSEIWSGREVTTTYGHLFFEKEDDKFLKYHPRFLAERNIDSLKFNIDRTREILKKLKKYDLIDNYYFKRIDSLIDKKVILHPYYLFYCLNICEFEKKINSKESLRKTMDTYEVSPDSVRENLLQKIDAGNYNLEKVYEASGTYIKIPSDPVESFSDLSPILETVLNKNFDSNISVELTDTMFSKCLSGKAFIVRNSKIKVPYYLYYFDENDDEFSARKYRFSNEFIKIRKFPNLITQLSSDMGYIGRVRFINYDYILNERLRKIGFKEGYDPYFSEVQKFSFCGFLFQNQMKLKFTYFENTHGMQ